MNESSHKWFLMRDNIYIRIHTHYYTSISTRNILEQRNSMQCSHETGSIWQHATLYLHQQRGW